MKRLSPSTLGFFAVLVCGLSACNKSQSPADAAPDAPGGKPKKIVFVTNGVASFWNIAAAGVKAAAADLKVDAQTLMPAEGIGDQKRILEDLLTRGVQGIAVSPIDPVNQTEILNTVARRSKLVTADSDAPQSERLFYVGMDNYQAGRMCGDLVREALPQGGTVMLFIGRLEQDNAKRRRQGVIDSILGRPESSTHFDPASEILTGNGFQIVGTLTDQFDRAKGKANAEDTLAKYPELSCMVGLFEYNTPLLLEALGQANKLGKIKVVSFDENAATLSGIEAGSVYGTVVQNPYMYGYKSVELLSAAMDAKDTQKPAEFFVNIPARQIRKNNVAEFSADLQAKMGVAR